MFDINTQIDIFGLDCNVKQKVKNILEDFKEKIRKIDPDAQIGFRGSVATGHKGPHKGNAPFDPNDFDIDVFIKSDKLFDADGSWWQGIRSHGYGDMVDDMESIFRKEFPGYRFDPSKPMDIRIFNQTKNIDGGIII